MTATIEAVTKDLQTSKAKVDQLSVQLEKEKTRGRALYEQFKAMQIEMQTAFGIEPSKPFRKRCKRTPLAALKSAASSLLKRLREEGKTPKEAKAVVLEKLSIEAKRELALSVLPDAVTRHIDKQIGKWQSTAKA